MKKGSFKNFFASFLVIVMLFYAVSPVQAASSNPINSEPVVVELEDGRITETSFMLDGTLFMIRATLEDHGYILHEYIDGVLVRAATIYHSNKTRMYITTHTASDNFQSFSYAPEVFEFADFLYTEAPNGEYIGIDPTFGPFPHVFLGSVDMLLAPFGSSQNLNPTHRVFVWRNDGFHNPSAATIRMINATMTMIQIVGLVTGVLGFGMGIAGVAANVIADAIGLGGSVAQVFVPNANFGGITTQWTFGTQGVVLPNSNPLTNTFMTTSYTVSSTSHHVRYIRVWSEFPGVEAWCIWSSRNSQFATRAFRSSFGNWSGQLSVRHWN